MNQSSLNKSPAGKLVNLLSNDLQRLDTCSQFLHYIWIMPFQAAVCFYILYQNLGISAVAGTVALIIEGIPIQGNIFFYIFFENIDMNYFILQDISLKFKAN